MWNPRQQQRERNERLRGWIIYLLYQGRPAPVEMPVLMRLLDRQNYPLTRRRLAEEIDYLRSLKLLRVFPSDAEQELDEVKQAKLCQRYADTNSDEEMGLVLCARITSAGINWQAGIPPTMDGISRVE
jgi:hypothetical protein